MLPRGATADQPYGAYVWTSDRFMTLVEAGVFEGEKGIELLQGEVVQTLPDGDLHLFIYLALQEVFEEHRATKQGMAATPTVRMNELNTFVPEFALRRREAIRRLGPILARDVLWVIEVSVSSRSIDLAHKKGVYAAAAVPHYWVFDGLRRGVWVFADPVDGLYQDERFVPATESLTVPELGFLIQLWDVFPNP